MSAAILLEIVGGLVLLPLFVYALLVASGAEASPSVLLDRIISFFSPVYAPLQ